jgi:hypothetical protein
MPEKKSRPNRYFGTMQVPTEYPNKNAPSGSKALHWQFAQKKFLAVICYRLQARISLSERSIHNTIMKSPNKTYARTFLVGAASLMTSVAFAEDAMVEPEIAICDFHVAPEPFDGEVSEKETPMDDVVSFEDEVIVDEEKEVIIDEEVVVDEDVELSTGEIPTDIVEVEPEMITCWDKEMLYRNNVMVEGNVVMQNVGSSGSASDVPIFVYQATGSGNASSAPQAADEVSALATVLKSSVSTNIHRVATTATAVKSNGRVFLR